MRINTIYLSYQGEVNAFGIGHPVIFIRTAGCHLRCYKKTMGILCDTPEALETDSGPDLSIEEIITQVNYIRDNSGGTNLVCLTGGDPLYRDTEELKNLFWALGQQSYNVSVETSGTLSISPYKVYSWVSWVLDFKSKSAGLNTPFKTTNLPLLESKDFLKFVLADENDYEEFVELLHPILKQTKARIAVGTFWGGKLTYERLIQLLQTDKLFGLVTINIQAHKMITLYDKADVSSLKIPEEI